MPDEENKVGTADAARSTLVEALIATGENYQAAFLRVYRLASSKLFGICLRICGNRQAAEDVLQEVYLTIWRRAGGYDPGRSSPITWLATIARNRAIDWRRSHQLPPPSGSLSDAGAEINKSARPGDLLALDQADQLLHRCLDDLEQDQRIAIRTALFNGLTYDELSTQLDISLGTTKSRVRRGLAKLKECLEDD